MDYTSLINDIRAALPGLNIAQGEPMSAHCSFRTGGPAAAMAFPSTVEQLEALCALLRRKGEKPLIIGNGTNLLAPDEGLDRFVVTTCPGVGQVTVSGDQVIAGCGATLASVAMAAADAGLTGREFAHGIPGSVGGGVVMNAGAYGGELKDAVIKTDYLDEDLVRHTAVGEEHDFSYRHSAFSQRDTVILRTVFSLTAGDREDILAKMRELAAKRRASQPLDMPSAGSTFKRPANGFAAALIDQAGLKGYTVGGAQVSEKHAGFVVNAGGATTADILRLMEHIQETVFAASGIMLEPEVRMIGR